MRRGWPCGVAALSAVLLGGGCTVPNAPEAPSFEVDLDIPVARELVTMQEVVSNRGDYLSIGPAGTVGVNIEQDVDRFTVGDNLRLSAPEANFDVPVPATSGSLTSELSVDLPDDIGVTDAQVRSGALRFDLSNRSGRTLDVSVVLPDFTVQGSPITSRSVVPSGGQATLSIDLDGAEFRPVSPQQLRFNTTVNVGTVGNAGTLRIELGSDPLRMDRVQGSFRDLRVDFEPSRQQIDFPDGQFDVTLTEATVQVQITNGIGADSELDMTAIGRRADGRSVTLTVPADQRRIAGGDPDEPAVSTITFNQANSNIVEFLNLIPTSIEVRGGILIDDPDARVSRTDAMDLKVTFQSPLDLVLGETTLFTDPRDISIDDQKVRDRLVTHFGASTLTFKMTNHLPVGVGVRLLVGGDSTRVRTAPELVIPREGEIGLAAAPVDPGTRLVRESAVTQQEIGLRPEEIRVFSQFPLFSRVEIRIPSTGGQQVRVVESDFAEILVRAKVRIRVDKDLVD